MSFAIGPSTDQILEAFSEEIAARGGKVTDTFHDGQRLFTRSILNLQEDVRPRDRLQGGVALKATGESVCVHPYLFRQVCSNGAIMAQTLSTKSLSNLDWRQADEALGQIRAAVSECCRPEVFEDSAAQMRSALEMDADVTLMMLPLLSRLAEQGSSQLLGQILEQFFRDADHSRFGFIQAVTSVARDIHEPAVRWDLEELGGGLAADIVPQPGNDLPFAARPTAVCVG